MKGYHSLLQRQISRILGDAPITGPWSNLLGLISDTYSQFDRDRALIERSMEISSQELLQANADIRAVLEGLIDYYLRIDTAGKILYGRGRIIPDIFNRERVVTGTLIDEAIIPEVKAKLIDAIKRMGMDRTLQILICEIGMEENRRVYEVRCVPAYQSQISVIVRDITVAQNTARREQKLQQRLARSERIESLGLLAGSVAHDLNNILSPLVSYPDLLMDEFPLEDPKRNMIGQMQKSAIRASAIIQDLLTLTRRGNHQAEAVDINKIIHQFIESPGFTSLTETHPLVTVDLQLASNLPFLSGSPHQLEQTVMNLITNAFEATSGQGIVIVKTSLAHETAAGETMDNSVNGPHILLEIIDNGVGIPGDELDHIFEPFFSRRKSGRSGTGLGLAIVYGTVKDYEGTIQVSSTPGQGTHFYLRFPIPEAKLLPPAPQSATENRTRKTCNVLVVDDDPTQLELSRHLLSAKGFNVSTVSSGREAVTFLRQHNADIVLLDMIMEEDFDGLQTYEAIRTFKPQQKCIIVSGYAKTDNVHKALELGVHSFVQKPYTLKTLLKAIEMVLGQE